MSSEEVPPETVAEEVVEEVLVEETPSSTMIYMVGLLLAVAVGGAAYYFLVLKKKSAKNQAKGDVDEAIATNSVGLDDIKHIASQLNPDSPHMDVLWAVISTPESIAYGLRGYRKKEKIRAERIVEDAEEAKQGKNKPAKNSTEMFALDDGGWAEDDDDDMDEEAKRKAKLEKEAEEQKKKDREQLQKATGKTKILLEGIDDGVIGQQWVESTLTKARVWPPKDLGILNGVKFEYEGKKVSPLDHPGLRRNICMMMGRLNSVVLNSHPELCK